MVYDFYFILSTILAVFTLFYCLTAFILISRVRCHNDKLSLNIIFLFLTVYISNNKHSDDISSINEYSQNWLVLLPYLY